MNEKLFDLSGKVALITGGDSGIGLGLAQGVVKHGADVCIWGINSENSQMAENHLKAWGTKVKAIHCDVSDDHAVEESFAETLEYFGRVDSCFANAGVSGIGNFADIPTEEWRRVLSVNLDGVFFTLRCAANHMKQRALDGDDGGRLIATSSVAGLMGIPKSQAYGASKGAVKSLMQSLAIDFAQYGVTANAIAPGHVTTAMTEDLLQKEKVANAVLPRIPAGRFGTKEDFEGIAVYLMSDASRYHTGDIFVIDGGLMVY